LSGSDDREKPGAWPEVERRDTAGRRTETDRRRPPAGRQPDASRYNPAERRRTDRRANAERRDDSVWEDVTLDPATGADSEGEQELIAAAADARTRAHARYSGFQVGAALETVDRVVVTGCNIENATYGLTLCAERVALVKAISDGHAIFTRIAVVTDTTSLTPPCGPCRQLLWEYCGDIDVVLANLDGDVAHHRLSALLPLPFDGRLLE
jgi:cytidine deaminase